MRPRLKAPESKLLKLEHEKTLSNFAFKFKLRRYNKDVLGKRAMSSNMVVRAESAAGPGARYHCH